MLNDDLQTVNSNDCDVDKERIKESDPSVKQEQLSDEFELNPWSLTHKASLAVNKFLDATDMDKRIDHSHVKETFDEQKKSFSVSVRCVFCDCWITLGKTPYSVSAYNYKNHINNLHLAPNKQTRNSKMFSETLENDSNLDGSKAEQAPGN